MIRCPNWLDKIAKEQWRKVYPELADTLTPATAETLAVLCQTYSHYRQADNHKDRNRYFDSFLKLAREMKCTARSQRLNSTPKETDELDDLLS